MAIFGKKKKAEKAAAAAATADTQDAEKSGRDSPQSAESIQGYKANPFATPRYSEPPSRDPQESSEGSGYFPAVQTSE